MGERRAAVGHVRRAARRFLAGLKHRSPAEAVEAGVRTAAEWCRVLDEERAAAGLNEQGPPEGRGGPDDGAV